MNVMLQQIVEIESSRFQMFSVQPQGLQMRNHIVIEPGDHLVTGACTS